MREVATHERPPLRGIDRQRGPVQREGLTVGEAEALDPLHHLVTIGPECPSRRLARRAFLDAEHPARLDEPRGRDRLRQP